MQTPVQEPIQQSDRDSTREYRPIGVSGLGGWLILTQIGLFLSLILLAAHLNETRLLVLNTETWTLLTSVESDFYHPLWGPVIIYECVYNLFFLVFSVYTIIAFYKKRAILPRLMIILYIVSLAAGIVDYLLLYQIPMAREVEDGSSVRGIASSALACAIWIPYFMKSKRVRNTFVR